MEITMEKQSNIGQIEKKNNKRKNRESKTMRMTTVGKKPIVCWLEKHTWK